MKKTVYLLLALLPFSARTQSETKPRLVVGIVVDQMSYDYLFRFQDKFSDNGFKKLMKGGTNCQNTQYIYVPTYTGPGHASIYTGTTPSNHGIVANEWFVRSTQSETNCVDDSLVKPVGSASADGIKSPRNLIANTITDQLRLTYPGSKVISVSIKDRSAILPGGHLSNGSYWFDYTTGGFLTSTFFKQELPGWVKEFNTEKRADQYLQQSWNTLYPIAAYTESGPDNSRYEHLLSTKKTPEFPYDFKILNKGAKNYELFTITPFANTFLADFALKALKNEQLGTDDVPDVLAISFSTPDIVGHSFGPYSVEIEDIYLRLDLEIEKILDQLESTIGKDNFVLFLTADHAVVPVPQYLADKQLPGGYVYMKPLFEKLNSAVEQKFGHKLIDEITNDNIYINRGLIAEKQLNKTEIEQFISNILMEQKGIKKAYTTQQLLDPKGGDEWLTLVQKGYRYDLSGDLIFILEPGYLPKSELNESTHKGTSHGSAFNYDTQVPLLWYGKGIPVKNIYKKVQITDITATLALILQVQRPNACTGQPIIEILEK
ncbi:MAG: alkaline phosphatase PafA [Bacteroidota bacterium]